MEIKLSNPTKLVSLTLPAELKSLNELKNLPFELKPLGKLEDLSLKLKSLDELITSISFDLPLELGQLNELRTLELLDKSMTLRSLDCLAKL